MSKRTSYAAVAANGSNSKDIDITGDSSSDEPCTSRQPSGGTPLVPVLTRSRASDDKQKDLLSSETGHFSLVRAMHLADLITELNGNYSLAGFRPFECAC